MTGEEKKVETVLEEKLQETSKTETVNDSDKIKEIEKEQSKNHGCCGGCGGQ